MENDTDQRITDCGSELMGARALDMRALRQRAGNVSRRTVARWLTRADPEKRLHRLDGCRRVLVSLTEFERFLEANTNA